MNKLRLGIIGCGFWSHYQTAAWRELKDRVDIVASCDKDLSKARDQAGRFGIGAVYDDARDLLEDKTIDFVDIITDVDSHAALVKMSADRNIPVICQKPMAPNYPAALEMVEYNRSRNNPFFIHENFRWQKPIRRLKTLLDDNLIGKPI